MGGLKFSDWLLDPIGGLVGENKVGKAIHGMTDPIASGTRGMYEGYKKNKIRGAIGGLSDTAAYGIGDFVSPYFTDKEGDNPIYDRVGPIMAGYWGGPIFGGIADAYARGSKYSEVGDVGGGSIAGGFGNMFGGSNPTSSPSSTQSSPWSFDNITLPKSRYLPSTSTPFNPM